MEIGSGTIVGSALNFLGGLFSNRTNKKIADENIAYQKEANEQNIAFQREENAITRSREDTAVQRAASDLTAAGLSKTLAAGQPASSQALQAPQTEAPNNSFKYESALQKMDMASLLQNMTIKQKESDRADALNDANVAESRARADLYMKQAYGQQLSNENYMENFQNEQLVKTSQAFLFSQQSRYYTAQAVVEEIVGNNKQREIDVQIDKIIQDTLKSYSDTQLNYSQIQKIAYDIAGEIIKQEGYKLDNEQKRKDLEESVERIAKIKLENQGLTHNLDFARTFNYPVGVMPTSSIGFLSHLGREKALTDNNVYNYAEGKYVDFMHNVNNSFKDLDEFYQKEGDVVTGGGLLEMFRSLLNLSPLNFILNKL